MNYCVTSIVFVIQEIVALIVFLIFNSFFKKSDGISSTYKEILKGILERLVLYTALIHNLPQMLIAFGAMKLGTRLHEDKNDSISNTYFLVGNFLSIWLAITGSIFAKVLGMK